MTNGLSDVMRDTLTLAAQTGPTGLRRIHKPGPGSAPWPAHPATLSALVVREMLKRYALKHRKGWLIDVWEITELGRTALEPVETIRLQRPVFLARAGGRVRYRKRPDGRWAIDDTVRSEDYTTDASRSIDNDRAPGATRTTALEVLVGPDELDVFSQKARDHERETLAAEGDRLDNATIEERVALLKQHAASTGANLSRELHLVDFMARNGRDTAAKAKLAELEVSLNRRAA